MRKEKEGRSRRRFLHDSAAGLAGMTVAGGAALAPSAARAAGYQNRDRINPQIPNRRVVYVHDTAMTDGTGAVSGWANQNAQTNDAVVAANIDTMACALAEEGDAAAAWRKIFIRPPGKTWAQTVVAVKTNNIAEQHTRNAVMKKFCEVLVGTLGVAGSNIHIYDGVHGNNMASETPFYGLPAGVHVEKRWGGAVDPKWPVPGQSDAKCVQSIANGAVDILLNIAMCKGHSSWNGNVTMAVKNHYGTFEPRSHSSANYVIAVNKSEAILGAMDPATGKILYPRQQLCFIDALWASSGGPGGQPTARPDRFFMGAFAPILDYLVAKRFRKETMGWSLNKESVINRFLTDFGYSTADLPPGGNNMTDALAWEPPAIGQGSSLSLY